MSTIFFDETKSTTSSWIFFELKNTFILSNEHYNYFLNFLRLSVWKIYFLHWIAWLDPEFLWIWHFPSLTSWWCPFLDSSLLLHIFRKEHPNVCNFGKSDYRQNNIQCYLVVPGKPFCVFFHSPVVVLLSCFLKA